MVTLHDEPGAKGRKPGNGGKFKADGTTPRNLPRVHPGDKVAKKAAKKAAKEEYTEGTVGTRVDKDVEAIWVNFDKLEGSLNRWLNKLARAAKVAGASTCTGCSSTHAAQAQWHGGG